jgi:uncharacterized membrane protein YdjX (TVP38/TMEM64 family)
MTSLTQRILHVLTIVGTVACLVLTIYLIKAGYFNDRSRLEEFLMMHKVIAPIIFVAIQIIQVVIPIIPGGISTAVGVVVFGPLMGFIYNYVGIVLGSIILFHLGRTYGTNLVHIFVKEKTYNHYMKWIEKGQKKYNWLFFIAIVLPVAPDDALVLLSSQTKMTFKFFLFSMFVGKPLPIYLYSFALVKGGEWLRQFLPMLTG